MPLYRKKPIVIEAHLWEGDYKNAMRIMEWSGNQVVLIDVGSDNEALLIKTLEGVMTGSKGDFIIRGVQGEYYPCKPDIFETTYEELDANGGSLHLAEAEERPWWAEENERLLTPEEMETYKVNSRELDHPWKVQ